MVRSLPADGDPVDAAKRARCERAEALSLLGVGSSAAAAAGDAAAARPAVLGQQPAQARPPAVVKDRLEVVCGRLAAAEEGRPIVLEGLRETKTTAQLAERLAAAEVRTLPLIATATTKDSWPANSERGQSAAS